MEPRKQSPWLVITPLLIWVIFLVSPAGAAGMKTAWVKYSGPEVVLFDTVDFDGCDVQVDSQGRVYTAGINTSQTGDDQAHNFEVFDSNGDIASWGGKYRIGLPRDGFLPRLTLDAQDKLYFSGNADSDTFFINKYEWVEWTEPPVPDVRLQLSWAFNQEGAGGNSLGPIAVDNEGNIYAGVNYKLYKFLPNGSPAGAPWPVSTGVANVTGIAMDEQHIFITGGNFVTEKHSKNGAFQWTQTLPPFILTASMKSVALALDSESNVFVTGTEDYWGGPNNVQSQIYTVKYSLAGVQLWVSESRGRRFRDYHNIAAGLVVDGQGNAYVAGTALNPRRLHTKQEFPDWGDFYTVKYAPDGTILWEKYFNAGGTRDEAVAIARDSFGNLVVTGTCKWFPEFPSTEPPTSSMATLSYKPDGQQQWVKYYEGPAGSTENEARALAVRSRNIYVNGSSKYKNYPAAPDSWHWFTIKYSPAGMKEQRLR